MGAAFVLRVTRPEEHPQCAVSNFHSDVGSSAHQAAPSVRIHCRAFRIVTAWSNTGSGCASAVMNARLLAGMAESEATGWSITTSGVTPLS